MKAFFPIILNKHKAHCIRTTFRNLLLSSYTTLDKRDVSKVTAFLLFRKKSVVFETSYVYNVAYLF